MEIEFKSFLDVLFARVLENEPHQIKTDIQLSLVSRMGQAEDVTIDVVEWIVLVK
jgi:hypothetical protein